MENKMLTNIQNYKNKLYLLILGILVILVSLSFADEVQTLGQQTWQQYIPAWFPLFSVAILIGFGLAGIAFMISRVFQLPQIETWARMEVFEVTGSAFLVSIILILLGVIDNLFIASMGKTPIDISLEFTNSISNELMKRYIDSVQIGAAIGLLSGPPAQYLDASKSNNNQVNKPGGDQNNQETSNRVFIVALKSFKMNFLTFYAADVFNGHYNLIQSIALTSLGISILSNVLLSFINTIAIPVLVPLGLFLSMFAITRKMGRTIIAFGVGLYVFVPLSIIIAQIMYDSAFKYNTSVQDIQKPTGNLDVDGFVRNMFAIQITDFVVHLAVITIQLATQGAPALVPGCITGASALASTCTIAQPVCTVVFTFICTFIGAMNDVGATNDLMASFEMWIGIIKPITLAIALDVPVDEQIQNLLSTYTSLAFAGMATSLIFHIAPVNTLLPNYIEIIFQQFVNFGTYQVSVLQTNFYALLNQYLAIRLTDITLAYTPYVMQFVVPIMLIPFIMLLVVITGIRSISPAIGGEIQILGISELV